MPIHKEQLDAQARAVRAAEIDRMAEAAKARIKALAASLRQQAFVADQSPEQQSLMQELTTVMKQTLAALRAPKRIIRDEQGRVVGAAIDDEVSHAS